MINIAPNLIGAAILTAFLGFLPVNPALADEMTIPVGSQGERSQTDLPRTGMSEESVRNAWGTPREIRGPVGKPPISQWHYDGFVVYFEGDRVLHAVLNPNR